VQSDVSDLQQSTRVAQRDMQRMVRMIGRGGLPRARAIEVVQDAEGLTIGGEPVVDETDVLTVRGALSSPVFRVDASDPASFQISGTTATLYIDDVTKSSYEQSLDALEALLDDEDNPIADAILLVGSQGDAVYAVVEMTNIEFQTVTLDVQNLSREVTRAVLTLSIDVAAGGNAAAYLALNVGPDDPTTPTRIPTNLTSVAFASVLEEHRFYIREDFSIPGDTDSPLSPKLARARMLPGTDTLHPEGSIDIADNVFDLQVALGVDLDGDGRVDDQNEDGTALATNIDEWLWNDAADDETLLGWDTAPLQHVRLSILGQAQTADRQYISPAVGAVENHAYTEPAVPTDEADIGARRYRRRLLQSTIDLRNL
jgi:hypothetical protein